MNRPIRCLLLCFFLTLILTGCSLSGADPEPDPLLFEEMEIIYRKYGGWIDTYMLSVLPSGKAEAKILEHASQNILNEVSVPLTEAQKKNLVNRFASFERYNRSYSPKIHLTDQNFHQIVLTYNGTPDTVSVYHPPGTSLPKSLRTLIHELEQLHQSILEITE